MNARRLIFFLAAAVVAVLLARGPAVGLIFQHGWKYQADLPHAAGIRSGDQVRVAGIAVGQVTQIAVHGDRVAVDFRLDKNIPLTQDTGTEIKVASLLGQRYLNLTPGQGPRLARGATIAVSQASGSYTLERFWLDSGRELQKFDLETLSKAVDVMATDLNGSPENNRAALDGLTALAEAVNRRDTQLARLLTVTRSVTNEAVANRRQLVRLMERGDKVFQMVEARKRAIDRLLRDSRELIVQLTAMAQRNRAPVQAALKDLHRVLAVLVAARDELGRTLELADPSMRLYVNSGGDGPWLGVNAPYSIVPDAYWCATRSDIGC